MEEFTTSDINEINDHQENQRRFTSLQWAINLAGPSGSVLTTTDEVMITATKFYNYLLNGPQEVTLN